MQAQWIKQSPIPTGERVRDACFINKDTGWIFGYSGLVMRTNDGGATWTDQSLTGNKDIFTGIFIDIDHGWIALSDQYQENDAEIYGTSDGGYTWNLQFLDNNCGIEDLTFINTETGWALAYYQQYAPVSVAQNFLLKTIDGGEHWFVLDSIDYSHFRKVDFINDTLGYIAGTGLPNLLKTVDGGMTWQVSPHASNAGLTDLFFTDDNNGYSCGNNFYYTHDAGLSWNYTYCYHSYGVDMFDESNGWTISIDKVYKVTNGGQNVDYQFTADKSIFAAISAIDSANAYAVGRNVSIYTTGDGGNHWQEISNGTEKSLLSVFFLNENDGWAGGNDNTLLITHDGGKHWTFNNVDASANTITDIQFINRDTGWLVNGNVLRSKDGGLTWQQNSGWTNSISCLRFLNSQLGWCVGAEGQLYKTMNGGKAWEEKSSGTNKDLNAVYFIDENSGWIAGDGIVKKTTDGGETWEERYTGDPKFLKIRFFNESEGYILADRLYLKTNTGGEYWEIVIPEGMEGYLADFCFIDQNVGFLSGSHYLFKTKDGGVNWNSDPAMMELELNAIFFLDDVKGWIAGENGMIYYTETGGSLSIPNPEDGAKPSPYIIYPNPSGDIFKIKYLPESGEDIEIDIYTLQGGRIRHFRETCLKPGEYSFDWDPGRLPSGIYLCKIRIGGFSDTEKMVFIK